MTYVLLGIENQTRIHYAMPVRNIIYDALQYGKQVEEKEIIARVKKAWTSSGNKIGDIKTMDLYIKPEESAVYYVINGTSTGAVAF